MRTNPTPSLPRTAAQIAVWTLLLILGLGWSRVLVVCNGPHCESQVEFVHQGAGCCEHEHDGADGVDGDRGDPSGCAKACHGRCIDVALGIETGPLPQRVAFDHDQLPGVVALPPAVPAVLHGTVAMRPPTTGPPRLDQRTLLLASTVLLL